MLVKQSTTKGATKITGKAKPLVEEAGPTEALGSVLMSSQEDVSKAQKPKTKKSEMEELQILITKETASIRDELKNFKEQMNIK